MVEATPGQKFQELKRRYVEGLPDRMGELRDSWNRLQHVSWDPKALEFMEHCAHKLAGSGATFQFPDISTQAQILEEHLQKLKAKSAASSAERQQLEHSLMALAEAVERASNTDMNKEPSAAAPQTVMDRNRKFRIAVIEDDADQAAQLKIWLEQQGYAAETFETPDAYNQRTEDHAHQLILLDVSFPTGALEGIAWLEQLKCQVEANTPVIMMSARSDMVARMRAHRAGADIYLTKPLDMGILEKRINQLLENTATARPRVLWVDDDTDLLAYYKTMLTNEGYEVDSLTQPVRILERIKEFQPDAIVLDHDMPGCRGMELAQVLRQDAEYMTIPILFVSASAEAKAQMEQHSIVGNEFFQKPLDEKRFVSSLHQQLLKARHIAARINLVSQRKESRGLQNHDFFLNELGALLARIETADKDQSHYLVQVSVDRQEFLRAQHGARAMASLNARMEKHFAQQLPIKSSGCALGGGSFLFQVHAPVAIDSKAFLEQFHKSLSTPTWSLGDDPTPITLSMGVLPLKHTLDEDKALIEVESACSEAMQAGGNSVKWQQTPERPAETKLDDRIQELVDAQAFKLYYQPIVNMETDETLFTALIRLVGEDNAVYLPGQFLQRLPEGALGPFFELDRWVIEHAVQDLAQLEGKAAASHSVAIKLSSPIQDVESLLPFLSTAMRNSRIKGKRRIYLALSCPNVIKDVQRAKRVAQVIQDMDCGLIIDHVDINTASVDLLRELSSVDFVKLVPKLGSKEEQTLAMENLLHQLKAIFNSSLPIVATGVEDARAVAWLWERGIRHFQGHFIQEPKLAMSYEL